MGAWRTGGDAAARRALALGLATGLIVSAGLSSGADAGEASSKTAARTQVELTAATCRRLVRYTQPDGVAYEPGVDVDGDPVAPAEAGGAVQLDLPETVTIPIELDVLSGRRLGPDDADGAGGDAREPGDPLIGEARIGTVAVDVETGRATFNGQPLVPEAQRRLAETCQTILRQAR